MASDDAAVRYNEEVLKKIEKLKTKNVHYSSMVAGSKIYNAVTGYAYPFLSGSRQENALWKVINGDKSLAAYYDSPEEWLNHRKKYFRFDNEDLHSKTNVVLWYQPSDEEVFHMKENGKKKVPKYLPKINQAVRAEWMDRASRV